MLFEGLMWLNHSASRKQEITRGAVDFGSEIAESINEMLGRQTQPMSDGEKMNRMKEYGAPGLCKKMLLQGVTGSQAVFTRGMSTLGRGRGVFMNPELDATFCGHDHSCDGPDF